MCSPALRNTSFAPTGHLPLRGRLWDGKTVSVRCLLLRPRNPSIDVVLVQQLVSVVFIFGDFDNVFIFTIGE